MMRHLIFVIIWLGWLVPGLAAAQLSGPEEYCVGSKVIYVWSDPWDDVQWTVIGGSYVSRPNQLNGKSIEVTFTSPSGSVHGIAYSGTVDNGMGPEVVYYGQPKESTLFATATNPIPPSLNSVSRCGAGSLLLAVGSPSASLTYRWFASAGAETVLSSGVSYSTPFLSTSQEYWVEARNASGCSSERTRVTALILNAPPLPVSAGGARFGPGFVSICIDNAIPNARYDWYGQSNGSGFLGSGTCISTSVSTSSFVWVRATDMTSGCSTSFSSVPISVFANPVVSINGSINLYPNQSTILSAPYGYDQYKWYKDNQELTITTPSIQVSQSGSYKVRVTKLSLSAFSNSVAISEYPMVPIFERLDSLNQNYILSLSTLKRGITSTESIYQTEKEFLKASAQFIDGLGRKKQEIEGWQAPSKQDIVSVLVYDDFGRNAQTLIPYASNSSGNLNYDGLAVQSQRQFYLSPPATISATSFPFSQQHLETSTASRPLEVSSPGQAWKIDSSNGSSTRNGHTIRLAYGFNASADVRRFVIDQTTGAITTNAFFAATSLSRKTTKDENDRLSTEFSNPTGKTLLSRREVNSVSAVFAETYYIYDVYDRLRCVIQPEGVKQLKTGPNGTWPTGTITLSQTFLDTWCFQYRYDGRGRIIEQRVPGGGWVHTVYNKADLPVLTQDAVQRGKSPAEWTFTKYDGLRRPILTGILRSSLTRAQLQTAMDAGVQYEQRATSPNFTGYTWQAYPTQTDTTLLSVTYYDDYDFNRDGTPDRTFQPAPGFPTQPWPSAHSLQTGGKVRVLGTNLWLQSWQFLDDNNRPILAVSTNHLRGTDTVRTAYNFPGWVMKTQRRHLVPGRQVVTLNDSMLYDHAGRLTQHYHYLSEPASLKLPDNPPQWPAQLPTAHAQIESLNGRAWPSNGAFYIEFEQSRDEVGAWGTLFSSSSSTTNPNVSPSFILNHIASNNKLKLTIYNNAGQGWEKVLDETKNGDLRRLLVTWGNGRLKMYLNGALVHNELHSIFPNSLQNVLLGNLAAYANSCCNMRWMGKIFKFYFFERELTATDDLLLHNGGGSVATNLNLANLVCGYDFTRRVNDVSGNHPLTLVGGATYDRPTPKVVLLAQHEYNELGQPIRKRLHSTNGGTSFLETVDTRYNIRGWIKSIAATQFSQNFLYEDHPTAALRQYNGNISGLNWTHAGQAQKKYDYQYDGLNRLLNARSPSAAYDERSIVYDLNGNIQRLTRTWNGQVIDSLAYDYTGTGNRLRNVFDRVTVTTFAGDFRDRTYTNTATTEFTYDGNGTLTADLNKGINLKPNQFNKPDSIRHADGSYTLYRWNTNAEKLRTIYVQGTNRDTTHYINGIQYKGSRIDFVPTAEGRVIRDPSSGAWKYEYVIKDHLGNTRVTFQDVQNDGVADVMQREDNYPFGLSHLRTTAGDFYKYLYNGKELQTQGGLGWYDYGFRFYDPALSRFPSLDPLANDFVYLTPYQYASNSPVVNIDLDGLEAVHHSLKDLPPGMGISSPPEQGTISQHEPGTVESAVNQIADFSNSPSVGVNSTEQAISKIAVSAVVSTANDLAVGIQELNPAGGVPRNLNGSEASASQRLNGGVAVLGLALSGAEAGATSLKSSINSGKELIENVATSPRAKASQAKPTLDVQAKNLVPKNGGRNSVTVETVSQRIRYDLQGAPHGPVPTPHKQIYTRHTSPSDATRVNFSRSREAIPMNQQDIRTVRNILERRNR